MGWNEELYSVLTSRAVRQKAKYVTWQITGCDFNLDDALHMLGALSSTTTTTMKSFASLLCFVTLVLATPVTQNEKQVTFNAQTATYPGFDLDLNALRLVEMEGQAPVWMTELDKVCESTIVTSICDPDVALDQRESSGSQILRHVSLLLSIAYPILGILKRTPPSTDTPDLGFSSQSRLQTKCTLFLSY